MADFTPARKGQFVLTEFRPAPTGVSRFSLPAYGLMRVSRSTKDGNIQTVVIPGDFGKPDAAEFRASDYAAHYVIDGKDTKAMAQGLEGTTHIPNWESFADARQDLRTIAGYKEE